MLKDKNNLKTALITALSQAKGGTENLDANQRDGKMLEKVEIDHVIPEIRLAPSRPSGLNDVYVA